MSNKNRLGRDPLEFIKDTRNDEVDSVDDEMGEGNEEMNNSMNSDNVNEKKAEEVKKEVTDNLISITKADIHLNADGDTIAFGIDGGLTIYSVAQAKKIFIEYIEGYSVVDIDLSAVKKIDTAGYQFLLFLKKEISQKPKTLNIHNASEEVNSIFDLYGETCCL